MKFFLWLPLTFLFISNSPGHAAAHLGYEQGNGGTQILCTKESAYKEGVFSLDRIEGEIFFKHHAATTLKSFDNENDIVRYVLKKLKTVNPTRAGLYERWLSEILAKREFIKNMDIQPINDGDVVVLPQGCKAKQAAVFITNPEQSQIRFLFDQALWYSSSPLDRAFLLLHELIYREARLPENRHVNSMPSRFINSWLFSHIENLSQNELLLRFQESNFLTADYYNIPIVLNYKTISGSVENTPIEMFEGTDKIKKAILYHTFSIPVGKNRTFTRSCPMPETPRQFSFNDQVEFFLSGRVKRLVFSRETLYKPGPGCHVFNGQNSLEFNEEGKLIKASIDDHPPVFP